MRAKIIMRWNPSRRLWQALNGSHLLYEDADAEKVEDYLNAAALAWRSIRPGTKDKELVVPLCQSVRLES